MTGSISMMFSFGFILLCQVAVHDTAKVSMSAVSGSSGTAVVSSADNTLFPSSFLMDTPASVPSHPDPTVTTTHPASSSFHSNYIQRKEEMKTSIKRNTNGMFFEMLVQNTTPDTRESSQLSGEYIAIIILSILCGIVLMMIIIYILCKHRCRIRFHVVTIRCNEDPSSSEVSLESGLPDGQTNMTPSASVSLDGTGHTSFIGADVLNSSLENSQFEETAQDPSNQDMRENNVTEFRHVIQSDYMDLTYFTSDSDKGVTDTMNKAGGGGPGAGNSPDVKDDKSKPVENHSSKGISTEARIVAGNDKPAKGTLKRPKLLYDKFGYTLVMKTGDNQFRIAEESDHNNRLKDSTSNPHNHDVVSNVGHGAAVNSPVSKHKSKTSYENVLLPKTKLVERLVGSSQTDIHTEEANPLVSPQIETRTINHYLDLYSQIDDDSCRKNCEMDFAENLSTETDGKQSGEAHFQNTSTDMEHGSGCAVSSTTTCSNVLFESVDVLQGLQEATPSTDTNSDYHSSGEDTSPEEDVDIMAYLEDYVPPKKTYLGIIYEYEEDVEFDEPDNDQCSEGDDTETEESAKEQANQEHANSQKQESDRMKTDEVMKEAKQEGFGDEDHPVGNMEILQTYHMNGENQADTERIPTRGQGEVEMDSVDRPSADEDATESCSEPVDYQGLVQTTERGYPTVDREDFTYTRGLQGKVNSTPGMGNMDVRRPEAVNSDQSNGTDTADESLMVEQEVAQEIAQKVAAQDVSQEVAQVIAQDGSQEVAQVIAQDGSQEVAQEIAQDGSQEVAQEIAQDGSQEVAQVTAQDGSQEVAQEIAQDGSQEVAQEIAQDGSQKIVQEVPQEMAQNGSQNVPQEMAHYGSQAVAQEIAQDGSQEVAQVIAQDVSHEVAQVIAQDGSQEVAQEIAQDGSQEVAQEIAQDGSQEVAQASGQEVPQESTQDVSQEVAEAVLEEVTQDKSSEQIKERKPELDNGAVEVEEAKTEDECNTGGHEKAVKLDDVELVEVQERDNQQKPDIPDRIRPNSIIKTVIEEAVTDNPRNEQVLEGQGEITETGTDYQIQEESVRVEGQPKEDEAEVGKDIDDDEKERRVVEAEKENQTMDIANCTQMEGHEVNYVDGNVEVQQSSDGVAVQDTTESVIHLDVRNEVPGENLQQEGKIKENDDKEHEATENDRDLCDGSRDIMFLDTEEEEEDEFDDDGWMELDEPISMVLAACQFSGNDDSDIYEMDCEDARSFDSNSQDEGAQVHDDCFVRDYIERLQFLQPTKGILCKEGETSAVNGGKRVSKQVRFTLPDEWNTC